MKHLTLADLSSIQANLTFLVVTCRDTLRPDQLTQINKLREKVGQEIMEESTRMRLGLPPS
jgi:hypothetical protein